MANRLRPGFLKTRPKNSCPDCRSHFGRDPTGDDPPCPTCTWWRESMAKAPVATVPFQRQQHDTDALNRPLNTPINPMDAAVARARERTIPEQHQHEPSIDYVAATACFLAMMHDSNASSGSSSGSDYSDAPGTSEQGFGGAGASVSWGQDSTDYSSSSDHSSSYDSTNDGGG